MRLDAEVLDWYKSQGPGYQTLMHRVLTTFMDEQKAQSHRKFGRAQELYRQYYAQCFWHYDPDLEIASDNFDLVVSGLRKYGGRAGLRLAEELCQ